MTTRVDLFADVPGQERAVAELVAAAAAPVHAYLFLGPAGTNKDTAAIAFAGHEDPQWRRHRQALKGFDLDVELSQHQMHQ